MSGGPGAGEAHKDKTAIQPDGAGLCRAGPIRLFASFNYAGIVV